MKENAFRATVGRFLKSKLILYSSQEKTDFPDMVVVPDGSRIFFIEFKKDVKGSYGLTKGQEIMIQILKEYGHTCLVLDPTMEWKQTIKDTIRELKIF